MEQNLGLRGIFYLQNWIKQAENKDHHPSCLSSSILLILLQSPEMSKAKAPPRAVWRHWNPRDFNDLMEVMQQADGARSHPVPVRPSWIQCDPWLDTAPDCDMILRHYCYLSSSIWQRYTEKLSFIDTCWGYQMKCVCIHQRMYPGRAPSTPSSTELHPSPRLCLKRTPATPSQWGVGIADVGTEWQRMTVEASEWFFTIFVSCICLELFPLNCF